MKSEKFKILQFIRELLLMIDKDMDNFPNKDIELKNRIRNNSYDILELAYIANTTVEVSNKKEMLLKMIAKLKIIDFLLNLTFDKKTPLFGKFYNGKYNNENICLKIVDISIEESIINEFILCWKY